MSDSGDIEWRVSDGLTPYDEALHLKNQTEHGSWVVQLLPSPQPNR